MLFFSSKNEVSYDTILQILQNCKIYRNLVVHDELYNIHYSYNAEQKRKKEIKYEDYN